MKKKCLFIIDGQNLIYRAFYALPRLTNPKGVPTGAVYGFATMVLKILKEESPDYIGVVFDLPGKTFRHKLFKEYKATRQKAPEELISQIPVIKEMVRAFNIPVIEKEGYEADDCIGTLAKKAGEKIDVFIVTGDKDALQLVNDSVRVVNRKQNETVIYDPEVVKTAFGVGPDGIIDMLALAGDSSDNIPGVKGIGEKTAAKLISQYKNIENLLEHLDELTPVTAEKIKSHLEDLKLSRELVTLDTNVPVGADIESLKVAEPDNEKLSRIFSEQGFNRLLKDVSAQQDLFGSEQEKSSAGGEQASPVNEKIEVVKSGKELSALISEIEKNKLLGFDLIASGSRTEVCIPGAGKVYLADISEHGADLKPLFENKDIKKAGYNLKEKMLALHREGIGVTGLDFDNTIARYLIEPEKYAGELAGAAITIGDRSVNPQIFDLFPLRDELIEKLKKNGLFDLFTDIEMPLIEVLSGMEIDGIKIDADYLGELGKSLEIKLGTISRDIYALAGEEFNINSPKVLGQILFEKLKLPPARKIKTGYSTDVDVLTKLAMKHELPQRVLDYRQIMKLKSTYVDALPLLINKETGRVHTSFNQTGTVTGRLSSSEPNMQNIPVKTELGREIRRAFVPEKGCLLISADYSQIELRVLAHLSDDQNLVSSFNNSEDIHLRTASEVFNTPINEVTDQMRNRAKVVNFGIVYGMSSFGLAQELGISRDEAQLYIDTYFMKYRGVNKYISETLKDAGEKGFVRTLFGRIRYTPNITSQNRTIRQFEERTAINSPIQGTASDLIKLAMVNVHRRLGEEGFKTRILLQIHDELLFESPEAEAAKVTGLIEEEMQEVYKLKVPLKVDMKKGLNWRDLK